jgi:ATP-dependent Clp protease ATP-binding subunit ClpC
LNRLEIHPSVQLAWAIANTEACLSGSEQIEPVHLLLAFLKIIDGAFHRDAEQIDLSPAAATELKAIRVEGRQILGLPDEEITQLRRSMRKSLRPAEVERPIGMLHRSPRSRDIFNRGAALAAEEHASSLTLLHLLKATLLYPSPDVSGLLPAPRPQKPSLDWETRVNQFAERFQLTRITLVLTDMENSMSVKRRFGDLESAKIFRAHDNMIREQLVKCQGAKEIKTIGDSFLLTFVSESEAIRFALTIQSGLRKHPYLSRIPVKVRVGIHVGEVLWKGVQGGSLSDPIFGIAIDTTARIASLAVGDQVLTDREVYENTSGDIPATLPSELGPVQWLPHGPYHLKGLDVPVEIFEIGEAGKAAFVRPKASTKAGPLAFDSGCFSKKPVSKERAPQPSVEMFGRDLTALARQGRLTSVVGRNKEIKLLSRHLQRTTKRNVILIGNAGVGKTALVEGLAQQCASTSPPPFLGMLRIVQINIADLVAGTKYRGDMEKRVQGIVQEATSDPNLILFLDEVHLLIKAGSAGTEAPLDVANILKPALARDDFRCIGATTTEDFERYLKNDSAFIRRFQVLRVSEPSPDNALQICRQWAHRIEAIQQVVFDEEAIEASVILSEARIRDRSLPDKAIDLLENAATLVKVSSLTQRGKAPTKGLPRIARRHIEAVLEEEYGIVAGISGLLDPGKVLPAMRAELVGQDMAIATLMEALGALSAKTGAVPRPLGVLMFTGPTGVGKTFAAECLARVSSGVGGASHQVLGRFNMSEYKEHHELARLIGAPPGFVGHEQPGALFRFAQSNPEGLILLDEMDKAHPEIQDYFLQIFDKAEATDSRGRKADFRQHLFVMTCNIVAGGQVREIGFGADRKKSDTDRLDAGLRQHFRREFLARIDGIIPFRPLCFDAYQDLFARRMRVLEEELARRYSVGLVMPNDVRRVLCEFCAGQEEGARGFLKLFERTLTVPLFQQLGVSPTPGTIHVDWIERRASFTRQ